MTTPSAGMDIPARVSATELAKLLDVTLDEVQAILNAHGEPSSPNDAVSPDMSRAIASTLGRTIRIEPRDLALEALYEYETRDDVDLSGLSGRARGLAEGVIQNLERLDTAIEEASEHWSVARMPVLDRAILRLGLYELELDNEVPTAVIISEAVRLAKTYSTERSGSFVNGVLASLARSTRGGAG